MIRQCRPLWENLGQRIDNTYSLECLGGFYRRLKHTSVLFRSSSYCNAFRVFDRLLLFCCFQLVRETLVTLYGRDTGL